MSTETRDIVAPPLGRWVYSTSDAWRTLEILGPFVPFLLALIFLRGSSPFLFVAAAVAGLTISGYGYFRGRDYELVIEPKRIRWGWVTSRADRMHLALERVTRVNFLRRHDGGGAIELHLTDGRVVWLPSMITEKDNTTSQAIVDCLKSACPNATIAIL